MFYQLLYIKQKPEMFMNYRRQRRVECTVPRNIEQRSITAARDATL